jgi:hypothetical protein
MAFGAARRVSDTDPTMSLVDNRKMNSCSNDLDERARN